MNTVSSIDIEEYCEAVRVALADLPVEVRDDLLEDLPDHLTEVMAEGEGRLRERLGEPAAYAEELRTAAGLEPTEDQGPLGVRAGLAAFAQRAGALAEQADHRLGRLVGYPRLQDLLRALRPGWWVLRGWIVAQLVCGVHRNGEWNGVVPMLHSSRLSGLVVTIVAIVASVWIGRRSRKLSSWPRGLMLLASAAIAVWGLAVLTSTSGVGQVIYVDPASSDPYGGYGSYGDGSYGDVYVYDQDGNAVPGARLYDQNGNPLQLGDGVCPNGDPAPGANPDGITNPDGTYPDWTYPVCPSAPGPFRSGPGPVVSSGAPTPSTPAASTPPAPTHSAPARHSATPTRSTPTKPAATR